MIQNLGNYKSWVTSFSPGTRLYRGKTPYIVMSAGIDFLILKGAEDGSKVRLFRNTPTSYEFYDAPPLEVTPS